MESLSPQEKKIYDYICRELREKGYSPSVRDIQKALAIKSTSTVHVYLKRLEESGYISKEGGKSRTLRVDSVKPLQDQVPVLGYVRAGSPIVAEQNFDGYVDFAVPKGYDREALFALRVEGDSMVTAGILDGDTVVVTRCDTAENGDIVVALVDDSATVKTFYRENGRFRLQPENPTMEPIILDDLTLLGRVIACLRLY